MGQSLRAKAVVRKVNGKYVPWAPIVSDIFTSQVCDAPVKVKEEIVVDIQKLVWS